MSIRRLKQIINDAAENPNPPTETASATTKLKDLVKNADTDYHKSLANRMAESYGYTVPNKYSWEKTKGGKRKTRKNSRKKRKTRRNRKSRRTRK